MSIHYTDYYRTGYISDISLYRLKQGLYPQQLSSLGRDIGPKNCQAKQDELFYAFPLNVCQPLMYPIQYPSSNYGPYSDNVPKDDKDCLLYIQPQ